MKLLHVSSSYPRSAGDPTAPFMQEMLEALSDRGHDVTVIVPSTSGLEDGERSGVTIIGARYAPTRLQVWGYGQSLNSGGGLRLLPVAVTPLALGSMARLVRRQIRRMRPDVVHLHWVLPQGVLASVIPSDLPIVVSAHGVDARFAQGWLRPLARVALARADAVIAASGQILQIMAKVHPSVAAKARVIPHGADAALFHPRRRDDARHQLGIADNQPVVLGVGRLVPKKGFGQLIQALSHVEGGDARLYLVGDGPDRPRLEALVPKEVASRIHFVGACDRERVADWYAASDVVVIPGQPSGGDVDSGPVVLVEALAAGRPVVVARTGMAPDVIRSGHNGVLVDDPDPKSLATAIDQVVAAAERMGREARQTFEELGDWNRVASDLESLYASLLRERDRPGTEA